MKSPNPSRAFLIGDSLCKLNTIGDKQHRFPTPFPVFTFLASTWTNRTLSLFSVYSLLSNLLSRQSMPVAFMVCINLLHLTLSNAFLPIYKARTQLLIYFQSSFWYYSQHPICIPSSFSSSTSKLIFSKCFLYFPFSPSAKFPRYFVACAMRPIVRWSLPFVAFGFFFKAVIVTSVKYLGHSPFSRMFLSSCVSILRPSFSENLSAPPGVSSFFVAIYIRSRSPWPCGLRCRFVAARFLRSRVRIPLRTWMFVSCKCCLLLQVEGFETSWSLVIVCATACMWLCDQLQKLSSIPTSPPTIFNILIFLYLTDARMVCKNTSRDAVRLLLEPTS